MQVKGNDRNKTDILKGDLQRARRYDLSGHISHYIFAMFVG